MDRLRAINLNLLLPLALLVETESVSEAARQAGVTPSAMSHALAALRALLEDPLLVRVEGRLRRTGFADTLRGPLGRTLAELDQLLGRRFEFDPARSQRAFTVSMRDMFAALLAPRLIARVAAAGPGLSLRVVPFANEGLAQALSEGAIDAAVGVGLGALPGVQAEPLYRDRFACLLWAQHPLAGKRKLDRRTYARLPHVLMATQGSGPGPVDDALAAHGLARRVVARLPYVLVAAHALIGTDAVLTLARRLARHLAATLPLVALEPPLPIEDFTVELGWHARHHGAPALTWLLNELRRAAGEEA
jgi:DNA-binding transcriptional LysR family regulator